MFLAGWAGFFGGGEGWTLHVPYDLANGNDYITKFYTLGNKLITNKIPYLP